MIREENSIGTTEERDRLRQLVSELLARNEQLRNQLRACVADQIAQARKPGNSQPL